MSSALFTVEVPVSLDKASLSVARYADDDEALRQSALGAGLWSEATRRFRSPSRRREWVASRLLLKQMGIGPGQVAHLPSGKPVLEDSDFHLSISHTQGYVAAMWSHRPCGIDVERFSPRVLRVRERFVDDALLRPDIEGDELIWTLLLCWSAKETIYKCMDEQGVDFRAQLHVLPFSLQQSGELQACETRTERRQRFTVGYYRGEDFVLTYTVGA